MSRKFAWSSGVSRWLALGFTAALFVVIAFVAPAAHAEGPTGASTGGTKSVGAGGASAGAGAGAGGKAGAGGRAGAGGTGGVLSTSDCPPLSEARGIISANFGSAIAIDPTSNSGTGVLSLENHSEQRYCNLSLLADQFRSTLTQQTLDSKVSWTAPGHDKASLIEMVDLPPHKVVQIPFSISGIWDAGVFRAPVSLDGKELGLMEAHKLRVPFGIELVAPGTDALPVHAVLGEALQLELTNNDGLNYGINWKLILDGDDVTEKDPPSECDSRPPAVCDAQPLVVPASSSVALRLCLAKRAFPTRPGAWFKEQVRHGVLRVSYAANLSGPAVATTKVFPVVIALGRGSEQWHTFVCIGVSMIVLIFGGLTSLFLTHAIPNSFQRLALRQKLEPLAARTKGLSERVPARLQIELRVTRLDLGHRVEQELMYFAGATEALEAIGREIAVLEKRVDLIGRMDDLFRRIDVMGTDGPPALLLRQVQTLLSGMTPLEAGAPSQAELDAAEADITSVKTVLKQIDDADPGLCGQVIAEATRFWKICVEPGLARLPERHKTIWGDMLRDSTAGFLVQARLRFKDGGTEGESLAKLDTMFAKAQLIAEYIAVCERATPLKQRCFDEPDVVDSASAAAQAASAAVQAVTTGEALEANEKDAANEKIAPSVASEPGVSVEKAATEKMRHPTQRERFFECLSGTGSRTLGQARLILREADQGIFVKQIAEQLRLDRFSIKVEPQSTLIRDRIAFSFVFHEDKFNDAAARAKFNCEWTFPHGTEERRENCWEAFQFFSLPGKYPVCVKIHRGADVFFHNAETPSKVVILARKEKLFHERTWLELTRLGLALAITMGALVTGARDQLQHLDLPAGLAAVFILGFGADVVKNIVSRTAQPPALLTPPTTPAKPSNGA